jgi:hypothetical protein
MADMRAQSRSIKLLKPETFFPIAAAPAGCGAYAMTIAKATTTKMPTKIIALTMSAAAIVIDALDTVDII